MYSNPPVCYVNCRAAEALLQRVQKDLQVPQGVTEFQTLNISSSLTQHQQKLVGAQALLNTARENNNHTHTLLDSINTNLPQYQVRTLTLLKYFTCSTVCHYC